MIARAPFTGKHLLAHPFTQKNISLLPGNSLGNGDRVINETGSQPLGISKHFRLKGMARTFICFPTGNCWLGGKEIIYLAKQSVLPKNVKYSLPKSQQKKLLAIWFLLDRPLCKVPEQQTFWWVLKWVLWFLVFKLRSKSYLKIRPCYPRLCQTVRHISKFNTKNWSVWWGI